jgi:hypothetical protein
MAQLFDNTTNAELNTAGTEFGKRIVLASSSP